MIRDRQALLKTAAALPLVAIVAVLAGWQPPEPYLGLLQWGTAGPGTAFAVLAFHAAPMSLVLLSDVLRRNRDEVAPAPMPERERPAVNSGPFGRLIE